MIEQVKTLERLQGHADELVDYLTKCAVDPEVGLPVRQRCAEAVTDYYERHPEKGSPPAEMLVHDAVAKW